jgi:hypothetical protein
MALAQFAEVKAEMKRTFEEVVLDSVPMSV